MFPNGIMIISGDVGEVRMLMRLLALRTLEHEPRVAVVDVAKEFLFSYIAGYGDRPLPEETREIIIRHIEEPEHLFIRQERLGFEPEKIAHKRSRAGFEHKQRAKLKNCKQKRR